MKNNFEQLLKNLYPQLFKDVADKDILDYITQLTRDKAYLSRSESEAVESKVEDGIQFIKYKNGDARKVMHFEKNGVKFVTNQHFVNKHGVITTKLSDMGKADFVSTFECISIENANRGENEPRQTVELYPNGNVFVVNGPKNAVYYKVDGKNVERTEIDYEVELAKRSILSDPKKLIGENQDSRTLDVYKAMVLYGPTDMIPVDTKNRKLVPVTPSSPASKRTGCAPWVAALLTTGLITGAIATTVYFATKDDNNQTPENPDTSVADTTTPDETEKPETNAPVVTPPVEIEKEEETTGSSEKEPEVEEVSEFNIQNYLENEKKVVDIITEVTSKGKEITSVFFEDEKLGDTYVLRTFADGSYDLLAQEGNSGYQVIFEGSEGVIKGEPKFDKNGMTIQMDIFKMNFNPTTGDQTILDPNGNVLTYDEVTIAGIPYGAIEEFVNNNPEEFAEPVM